MSQECVVAVYKQFDQVKEAVQGLEQASVPNENVSLVTQSVKGEIPPQDQEMVQYGDKSGKNLAKGAGVGGLLGVLLGAPLLTIPGMGAVLLAGPLAMGATGAVVGGFLGAMAGWGVHEDHVRQYEKLVREGRLLVVVHGTPSEIADAKRVLDDSDAEEVHLHAATSADASEINDRHKVRH